jgi:transposase
MSPLRYRSIMQGKTEGSRFEFRLELVRYALEHGVREAARAFRCSRNTVRLWVRRYGAEGAGGLVERSRAPKRIPHKTPRAEERRVIAARQQVPCMGPRRLKRDFGLKAGKNAIGRILREAQLTRRKRRKHEKKADLRAVKAAYRALEHLQMDVKVLWDIAAYWPQLEALGLPRYQYTIRDTKSGGLLLAFGRELSVTYASLLAERCLRHLGRHGIELSQVVLQTDRGAEFSGGQKRSRPFGFSHTVRRVCGARHLFTPPRWPNANADVEASHRLIEEEFFALERFWGLEDFLRKATVYQHYFNFGRPNSYKGDRTPWDLVQADRPGCPPGILALPPVLLEAEYDRQRVGQDVPGLDEAAPPPR